MGDSIAGLLFVLFLSVLAFIAHKSGDKPNPVLEKSLKEKRRIALNWTPPNKIKGNA